MEELDKISDGWWKDINGFNELPERRDYKAEMLSILNEWWNGKKFNKKEKKHYFKLKDEYCSQIYYDYLSEGLVEEYLIGIFPE